MFFCFGFPDKLSMALAALISMLPRKSENYAYLGLYWTWGGKKTDGDKPGGTAFNGIARPGFMGRM